MVSLTTYIGRVSNVKGSVAVVGLTLAGNLILFPKTDGFSDDDTVVVVAVANCTVIETVEAEDVTPKPVSVTEIVSAPEASVSVNDHAPVFASAVMVSLTP